MRGRKSSWKREKWKRKGKVGRSNYLEKGRIKMNLKRSGIVWGSKRSFFLGKEREVMN